MPCGWEACPSNQLLCPAPCNLWTSDAAPCCTSSHRNDAFCTARTAVVLSNLAQAGGQAGAGAAQVRGLAVYAAPSCMAVQGACRAQLDAARGHRSKYPGPLAETAVRSLQGLHPCFPTPHLQQGSGLPGTSDLLVYQEALRLLEARGLTSKLDAYRGDSTAWAVSRWLACWEARQTLGVSLPCASRPACKARDAARHQLGSFSGGWPCSGSVATGSDPSTTSPLGAAAGRLLYVACC